MISTLIPRKTSTIRRMGIALVLSLAALAEQSVHSSFTLASPSINVCPACAYTTIQSAIDAATGITTIYIASGTYKENLHVPGALGAHYITLWANPSATVDGSGNPGTPVLTVAIGSTVLLINIGITKGSAADGAGIHNAGTLSLLGTSSVYGNTAVGHGGGIYNTGTLTLHNASSVHDDLASLGGAGIYNTAAPDEPGGTVLLEDTSSVYHNSPIPFGALKTQSGVGPSVVVALSGGGILNSQGSVTLEDSSTVHDNGAFGDGGIANDDVLTIQDRASVYHNAAGRGGGGVGNDASMTMLGASSVHDNVAVQAGGILNSDSLIMRGTSSVYLNTARSDGGGILNESPLAGAVATVSLHDFSTVHDNSAGLDGGGIFTQTISAGFSLSTRAIRQKILPSPNVAIQDGSSVYHNSAEVGAGVYISNDSLLVTATGSIHDNSATIDGGGVYNNLGIVQFTGHGSLYRNSAPFGGGVYNLDGGVAFYDNTTAHDNSAPTAGGAVFNVSGTVGEGALFTVNFSAIYHNTSTDGAAVYNAAGYVELDNISSLNHNTAARYGGGIFDTPAGTITANDTSSIDHNTAGSQGGGIYAPTTPPANIVLWGANAVTFNTPNNCYPVGSFPPCLG
jgi:predicted outer membrane repeat protein